MQIPEGYTIAAVAEPGGPVAAHLVADLVSLIQHQELADLGEVDTTAEEVADSLKGADAAPSLTFVAMREGKPVAAVLTECFPELREVYLDIHRAAGVPEAVIDGLLRHHEEQAIREAVRLEAAAAEGDGPATSPQGADRLEPNPGIWQFMTGLFDREAELHGLLLRSGFSQVRTFFRMLIEFDDQPPNSGEAPALPAGVSIRRVDQDDDADARLLHGLYLSAFEDHWGQGRRSFESWLVSHRASAHRDPDGWFVAELDGRPVGELQLSNLRVEFGHGYVETLGVLRDARGLGIASGLLQHAFQVSAQRGLAGCELGVDTDSPTGADRLYRRNGMRPHRVVNAYCKPFDLPSAG